MGGVRSRRQSGLTLIEVFIASLILSVLFAMSAYLIWSSSRHVETSESALQLEVSAREFLDAVTKELHQTKMTLIQKVDTTQLIPVDSVSLKALPTPGTLAGTYPNYDPVAPAVVPHTASDFDGIRFKLPGYVMDLTKNNANADNNSTLAANQKKFDLKAYKASTASAEATAWLYEVQYWWEIDNTDRVSEGVAGAGPNGFVPDGVDNNKNGVIDEGVICKLESWFNTDGTLQRRTKSVVCKNVKSLKFFVPRRSWSGSDWAGTVVSPSTQIVATVVLEKADPKYPKNPSMNIIKTVSAVIDLRN